MVYLRELPVGVSICCLDHQIPHAGKTHFGFRFFRTPVLLAQPLEWEKRKLESVRLSSPTLLLFHRMDKFSQRGSWSLPLIDSFTRDNFRRPIRILLFKIARHLFLLFSETTNPTMPLLIRIDDFVGQCRMWVDFVSYRGCGGYSDSTAWCWATRFMNRWSEGKRRGK